MAKLVLMTTLGTLLAGALIPDNKEEPIPLTSISDAIFSPAYRVSGTYVDHALHDLQPDIPQYIPPPPPPEPESVEEPKIQVRAYTPPPRTNYGNPSESQWLSLRLCESSDNPRAISPQGWYRGLYQFDLSTWRSVGGTGDPIDASRDEQNYRAQLLYAARGPAPWPTCGRFLYN